MNASRNAKRAGHVASKSSSAMADSDAVSIAPVEDDLGLPGWINDLLKPGVGQGVFVTLKVSLVLLVLTLGSLLIYIEDAVTESTLHTSTHAHRRCVHTLCTAVLVASLTRASFGWPQTARLHMKIFLCMACVLLMLVVWFIGELARETKLQEMEKEAIKKGE